MAEIFRDIKITLLSNCVVDSGPPVVFNSPPQVNAPFLNPYTGIFEWFTDTVEAGDTVSFTLNFTDFDSSGAGFQMMTINAFGNQFGLNFTDPDTGCSVPPCATLSVTPPILAAGMSSIDFNWITDCSHVWYQWCQQQYNVFNFAITAKDDFCPANGITNALITVVVTPPPPCITVGEEILEERDNNKFSIFPNPSEGSFTITSNLPAGTEINIFDYTGKLILKEFLSESEMVITLPIKPGIYFLTAISGNKSIAEKIIIN